MASIISTDPISGYVPFNKRCAVVPSKIGWAIVVQAGAEVFPLTPTGIDTAINSGTIVTILECLGNLGDAEITSAQGTGNSSEFNTGANRSFTLDVRTPKENQMLIERLNIGCGRYGAILITKDYETIAIHDDDENTPRFLPVNFKTFLTGGSGETDELRYKINGTWSTLKAPLFSGKVPSEILNRPQPPTALSATNISDSGFTANLNAAAGATGYRLDVSTDANFTTFVSGYSNLNIGASLSYSVTGLSAVSTYYYRVRAVNGSGTSMNSNVITVTTT